MTVSDALLPEGRFGGVETFKQRVRDALVYAATSGWRELVLCDPDFHDWPLGERVVAEALQHWASQSGRKLVMLAGRYDEVVRCHARFVTWRRVWAHLIECRQCSVADMSALPSVLWTPAWVMQRQDLVHSTGICTANAQQRLLVREALQEWGRQSAGAFPAHVLGL
jgi:hypothetical protein